jgi:[acyl-carrier-protein] S-malonyltransferase
MSLALLFPGQGTQHPAMLQWLDDQPEAADVLGRLIAQLGGNWRCRLTDAHWAAGNAVAQTLITGLGIAAWQCIAPLVPAPAAIAGYSVGELPAFCVAGVFDASTALALARDRAEAMQCSVAGRDTGLLSVQGAARSIAHACRQHGLAVAIRLAADRVVLGGASEALDAAQAALTDEGARCTRLAVRIASHTPGMASAAAAFAVRLASVPFAAPQAALICNASGATERRPEALKQVLAQQIARTVPWDDCMDAVAERRVRCVLEVGPGTTLTKLWNERHPDIPARSVDEFRSPLAVAQWVRQSLTS